MRTNKIDVPLPSSEQVEYYLRVWDELEKFGYLSMFFAEKSNKNSTRILCRVLTIAK